MYYKTRIFLALLSLIGTILYNLARHSNQTAFVAMWIITILTDLLLIWFTYKAWKFSKKK